MIRPVMFTLVPPAIGPYGGQTVITSELSTMHSETGRHFIARYDIVSKKGKYLGRAVKHCAVVLLLK